MLTRQRKVQPPPEPEQEEEDHAQSQDECESMSLRFNEALSWRPGKPIGVQTLITRLEKLSAELMDLEQETTDKESLNKVAKDLASSVLINHKDKGVRALTASCLVDILRICAPDAPFTPVQLKDIFTMFIKHILPGLKDPAASYHAQYKYVLSSLAEVQSILLLNEMDQADDLMVLLFSTLFDTVSSISQLTGNAGGSGDIEYQVTEMLTSLVDEGQGLPTKVVDVIMAQFLRAASPRRDKVEFDSNQSTIELKEIPAAYSVAASICARCADKMSRYIGQYFSDVVFDALRGAHEGGETEGGGPSEDDLKELSKAHLLVRELWRAVPHAMSNVIPQLEQELNVDNVDARRVATETIGDMIAGIGAAGPPPPPTLDPLAYPPLKMSDEPTPPSSNVMTRPVVLQSFIQAHGQTFRHFIHRRNDKSHVIRIAWTRAVGYILSTKAGGTGLNSQDQLDLVKYLGEKLNDADDKVRLACVKAIETFSFQDVVNVLGPSGGVDKRDSVLASLADRARDRKHAVRVEATILLAKLWAVAGGEIAAGEESVTSAVSGIPNRLFGAYYASEPELNLLLDRVIFEYLVPIGYPPPTIKNKPKSSQANSQTNSQTNGTDGNHQGVPPDHDRIRAERILLMARSLDLPGKKAMFSLAARQPQLAQIIQRYVELCEQYNAGVVEHGSESSVRTSLEKSCEFLAKFVADQEKGAKDLFHFAKLHDRRSYQLIKFSISSESDFKTVFRAIKELTKRFHHDTHIKYAGILDTLIPILYRGSCLLFNRSYLSTFMDHSRNEEDGYGPIAAEILGEISNKNPQLFKMHVDVLRKDLEDNVPVDSGCLGTTVIESLKAYSSYSRKYPEEVPQDRKFVQTLMGHALYGPIRGAKFAVNIMLANKNQDSLTNATELLQRVMEDWSYGAPYFLNRLAIVAQLESLAPTVALDADEKILEMTIKQVIHRVRTPASDDSDPDFVEDLYQSDEELQAKVWALKINVNRIMSNVDEDDAREQSAPVFKLLRKILNTRGEISKDPESPTPQHHQTRLRLVAAKLYLKLCTNPVFDELLPAADFDLICLTAQDPQPMVRRGYVERLQKYLSLGKLRHRFLTAIFIFAYEPNRDLKNSIDGWIRSRVRHLTPAPGTHGTAKPVLETVMGRLISLLAHHPDFSSTESDLLDHAQYLIYYISMVATEDNIGMIHRIAERAKQTRDAVVPEKSENVYVICDLALAVIRKWLEKKNWAFNAYAGKVGLPKGLYSGLPNHKAAQEIAEKSFIPDGIEALLDERINSLSGKTRKRKTREDDGVGGGLPSRQAKKTKGTGGEERKEKPPPKKTVKQPRRRRSPTTSPQRGSSSKTGSKTAAAHETVDAGTRRSTRAKHTNKSYAEHDSEEDDEEMLEGVAEWKYEDADK